MATEGTGNSLSLTAMARLVTRSQAGDRTAFGELYDATFVTVYRYALAVCHNHADAEDITEETYERALRRIGSYEWRGVSITAWLIRITQNVAREHLRRRQSSRTRPLTDDVTHLMAETPIDVADDMDMLRGRLLRLSPAQREVISLRLAGFTVREMAEILDKAEGTIKSLQFAALARLRTDDDLPA